MNVPGLDWAGIPAIVKRNGVGETMLRSWLARHPECVRKFGSARNNRTYVRLSSLNAAFEDGTVYAEEQN